jgi:hypothetical protein
MKRKEPEEKSALESLLEEAWRDSKRLSGDDRDRWLVTFPKEAELFTKKISKRELLREEPLRSGFPLLLELWISSSDEGASPPLEELAERKAAKLEKLKAQTAATSSLQELEAIMAKARQVKEASLAEEHTLPDWLKKQCEPDGWDEDLLESFCEIRQLSREQLKIKLRSVQVTYSKSWGKTTTCPLGAVLLRWLELFQYWRTPVKALFQ